MLAGWRRRIAEIVGRGRVSRDLDDELAAHVAAAEADLRASGLDAAEARRQAALTLGPMTSARDAVADERTGATVEQLAREVRQAWRALRRAPALTTVSALTMAIGIGASTVLVALVDGVVLRPLPYPDADRLVRVVDVNPAAGVDGAGVTTGNLFEWGQRARAFSAIAGHYAMGRTLSADDRADVVIAAQVTAGFFAVGGVAPLLGRPFSDEEYAAATFSSAAMPTGANPVAIIGEGLWRSRFGADPALVGRTITLERRPFTVVGVMPGHFALPDREVQVWLPWRITAESPRDQHYVGATARVAPGRTVADAERDLAAVAADLARAYPATNQGWSVRLVPLHADLVGTAATALWLLVGAVGLLLAVGCANVALLTLMRGMDRAGDAAVRLALGASPARLVREFLMESSLVAVLGGVLGLALAASLLAALPALAPDLPRLDEVRLDGRVLAVVAALTAAVALLAGWPQAWRRARLAPLTALAEAGRRTTTGGGSHRMRDGMAMAQVALAVMLLVGAGLLVRSVRALAAVDPGFDPRGVLVAPVFLDSQAYATGDRARAYYRTLLEKLAALPGVVAVGGATTVPTSPLGPDFDRPVWPDGTSPAAADRPPAAVRMVTPGYFAALGLRIAAGRRFDERDAPTSPRVVMVNETLARRLWPGTSPVGRQLVVDYSTTGTHPYEVVGVVGDMRFGGPRSEPRAEIYLPHAQRPYLILNVVVKTAGDPRALAPAVRAALHEVDPQKPAQGLHALDDLVAATYARDRQVMATLVVFAGAATALALLAVYGVLSHRVRERTREIGIRMAMGADAAGVMRWVAGAGLRLVAAGGLAGLATAWAASSVLDGVLFGVAPSDAVTLATVVAVVALVGLAATALPSWRATRVDPVTTLRRG
ncbi:MAG: ABC transporter permease [Vicinamibacterales bacterium]